MGILRICNDVPAFVNGAPLSPTGLGILRDCLLALDEGTRLGGVAFCGLYGQHAEEAAQQNQVIWRGGGVWRTGMSTLRVVTFTKGTVAGGDTLRIYRGDDDSVFSDHTLAAGAQTFTPSIASGYGNEQVLRVRCEVRHSAAPPAAYAGCQVEVQLAEFLPVFLADAGPFLPAFSTAGEITGTTLTQLATYIRWLIRRVGLRYDPLFIRQLRRNGPYCIPGYGTDPNVVWRGGHRKTPLHPTLRASGAALILWGGATESVRLLVNGSVVASTTLPTTLGETAWSLTHSLTGYSDGTALRLALEFVRTAPTADGTPINRWSVERVGVDAPADAAATLGSWAIRQTGVTAASLVSWLQSARALCQLISDRITLNEGFWGVQRLYTARPAMSIGADNSQFSLFEPWSVPYGERAGDAIVGRGRALNLGFRAAYYDEAEYAKTAKTNDGIGAWPLVHTRTQSFIDGNDVETGRLYLDQVPGLPIGSPYMVRGVESYVLMEQLKVVA